MNNLRNTIEQCIHGPEGTINQGWGLLLQLLSICYGAIVRFRLLLYRLGIFKTHYLPAKVISIGNIVAGGTGKTPATILMANTLRQKGEKVVVVSRGYGGRKSSKIPYVVSDGKNMFLNAIDAGDEPVLISLLTHDVPVIIGQDRFKAGQVAIREFNAGIILLDDGFQHVKLHRDFSLLLMDAGAPLGNGKILPRGPMREPITAINRADVILFTRSPVELGGGALGKDPFGFGKMTFRARHSIAKRANDLFPGLTNAVQADSIENKNVFLFSGIADGKKFEEGVCQFGGIIRGHAEFPDHHYYSENDRKNILRRAIETGASVLVTTDKDAARLGEGQQWKLPLMTLGVEMEIQSTENFWDLLQTEFKI
ncbi:tetraacyldisaccharide 4'-kinase [Desulfobacterales bacterium HSG17]|nr:tetraacyldisaccharide 4'-kinase [Desulfobacterales bacterium HSG17]